MSFQKVVIVASATLAICVLIVVIVLISVSYAKVEMTEVALLYSHASRRIDREKLYPAGRYYVGVGGEFIKFPITQQEMELPVFEARTQDGLRIELQVSLNYKVEKSDFKKILSIYDHFGAHYDGFISRLAMNIIRDAAATFNAFSYSINRSQVSLMMEQDLRDDLAEIGFALESVQLLNIQFPTKYSDMLSHTLNLKQQVSQAELEKEAEKVSLEGELAKSNYNAEGVIYDALSQKTTIEQNAVADAEALTVTLEKEGIAHKLMIDMFNDRVTQEFIDENGAEPDDDQKKVLRTKANQLFIQWFWMNKVEGSPATKNLAVGIPDDLI